METKDISPSRWKIERDRHNRRQLYYAVAIGVLFVLYHYNLNFN